MKRLYYLLDSVNSDTNEEKIIKSIKKKKKYRVKVVNDL